MKKSTLFRLLGLIQARTWYWPGIIGAGFSPVMRDLVVGTWSMGVIDAALAGDIQALISRSIIGLIAMAFMSIYSSVTVYAMEKGVTITAAHIRRRVFDHVQRIPYKENLDHHSGDFISRATNDIRAIEGVYLGGLLRLLYAVLGAVVGLIAMFFVNWRLGLVSLGITVLITGINLPLAKPLRKISRQIQTQLGKLTQQVMDILASTDVTRIYNLEKLMGDKAKAEVEQVRLLARRRVTWDSVIGSVGNLAFMISFIGTLALGGVLVMRDLATLPQIVFVIQMQNSVSFFFSDIGLIISQLQAALAGADRVLEVLDIPTEPDQYKLTSPAQDSQAELALININFSYDQEPVLKDLTIEVPPGKTYALVGASGSGKSTIFKLILGLYPPSQGDIIVKDLALSNTPLWRLREQVAFVPQESWLFAASIAENIACGKTGATQDEIEKAAKAANAHDFILQLPQGYNTPVGERGSYLSGGQRQRIAIARALLKDAPILLLDEATSALDTESEQLVQQALETLMEGRTTLVVAHRLSTIQKAHEILVLDKGKVVEQGTHEELLEKGGLYQNLHQAQFKDQETA